MPATSATLPCALPVLKRCGVSPLYLLAMLLVMMWMVLSIVLYLAIAAGICWLVRWHLYHNTAVIFLLGTSGRGPVFMMIIGYISPAVLGSMMVLFMLKPFLLEARPKQVLDTVDSAGQPELIRFIHAVCNAVGAPHPRVVEVDCRVNASAKLSRGWGSILGRDLTLTIGLPLVAGLNLRQLAGVLAHEFGHFTQGGGMRLGYAIRAVNSWFARAVYEEDWLDVKLHQGVRTRSGWPVLLYSAAKIGISLSRRILALFMKVNGAVSAFLSRQREFDADTCMARVAGSEEVGRILMRLRELSEAEDAAFQDVAKALGNGQIPEDLPSLVGWRDKHLPDEVRRRIQSMIGDTFTKVWDTHPADADRITAAMKLRAPGIFDDERPASVIFAGFPGLCHFVTLGRYEEMLDVDLNQFAFCGTDIITGEREKRMRETWERIHGWYGRGILLERVRPLAGVPGYDWYTLRNYMANHRASQEASERRYAEFNKRARGQRMGLELIELGFREVAAHQYELQDETPAGARRNLEQTLEELHSLRTGMHTFDLAADGRLATVLAALERQPCLEAERHHRHRLIFAQRALGTVAQQMIPCLEAADIMRQCLKCLGSHPDPDRVISHCNQMAERYLAAAARCLEPLRSISHPYMERHPSLLAGLPASDDYGEATDRALKLDLFYIKELEPIFARVMGDLCGMAIDAEKRLAG